jgi:hypothetical protein
MATADDGLTNKQRVRILREVILGIPARPGESSAAVAWRRQCEADIAKCRAQGFMPEIPFDLMDED